MYLENSNLYPILSGSGSNRGSRRESFLLNQLRNAKHQVSLPTKGDFLIDRNITIEVGGKNKGYQQLAHIDRAYIAADDIEIGVGQKIPLWLFGLLY